MGGAGHCQKIIFRYLTEMDNDSCHLAVSDLQAGLDEILRPQQWLVGDNWLARYNNVEGADYDRQLTLMNSRVIALVAGDRERWPLAGDQLYIDLDLSLANLPPGSRLAVRSAVIEISAVPHTPCRKFQARFGQGVFEFANSEQGRSLKLRGVNAQIVEAGTVRVGDSAVRAG